MKITKIQYEPDDVDREKEQNNPIEEYNPDDEIMNQYNINLDEEESEDGN